jgi:hypothetical protein
MDLAKDLLSVVGRFLHSISISDVQLYGTNGSSVIQRAHRLIEVVGADVGNDHSHACAGECARHSETDTAGAASYESNFASYVVH